MATEVEPSSEENNYLEVPQLPLTLSSESAISIVGAGWSLLSPNSEILIFMVIGVIGTVLEVAGYWPEMRMPQLVPEQGVEQTLEVDKSTVIATKEEELEQQNQTDLESVIYKIADGVDLARFYSVHIYLAAYILLPYPLLTERQKVLLTPWLLCGMLRSIALHLLLSLSGMVLCASQETLNYSCLKYTTIRATEFCVSLFMWTAVHNFYYYLDRKRSQRDFNNVLKTITEASIKKAKSFDNDDAASLFSLHLLDDTDDDSLGAEHTLVERAAMAWIAREILENGENYITDGQFSTYLAIKATEELRHIISELALKREDLKKKEVKSPRRRKIEESLEFLKRTESESPPQMRPLEAFEQSKRLSRRDPLRRIPPLTFFGKPFEKDSVSINSTEIANREDLDSHRSAESEVEVQTDPLSPEMEGLFNVLEKQHSKKEAEHRNIDENKEVNQNTDDKKKI